MSARLPINPPADQIGRANVVIGGTSRSYHVDNFEGSLSIKTVVSGLAVWRAGGRRFEVNENCWLVLNDRRHYDMSIESRETTTTFCLFFERGFVEDIWRSKLLRSSKLLDSPQSDQRLTSAGFFERLESENSPVLQKVRRFRRAISNGEVTVDEWEDQYVEIGAALVAAQRNVVADAAKLSAVKESTRLELCKRVLRGRDLLLSSGGRQITLNQLARESCMSPYHFHRTFRQLFSRTPHAYLTEYRLKRAAQQLCRTKQTVTEICLQNGFESLPSFSTLFRKRFGVGPREFRLANGRIAEIRKIG